MSQEPETTQILIQQVQQGNQKALEELCNRYYTRVLAAVRIRLGRKLRSKVESWDIVQDVMVDALRTIGSFEFRTEGAFLKYLNQVVRNRIRDEADYRAHMDYVHFNPVKHGWVSRVSDWPYSTFHRLVEQCVYPPDWAGGDENLLAYDK